MAALGFAVCGVGVFVLGAKFSHAWLPIAMGAAYCCLIAIASWKPSPSFTVPNCATMLAGATALWLWTSSTPKSRHTLPFQAVLATSAGIALLFGLASLLAIFSIPKPERQSAVWMTVLVLLGWLIAYFSSSAGGPDWMLRFFEHRFGMLSEQADVAVLIVRKTIHFVFYGSVAFAASKAALAGRSKRIDAMAFGLLIALAFASFDEMRQSFVPVRTGSAFDVLLDLAGAATFLCIPPRRQL
jgi:VanZ family protein